jgi:HD domain
MCLLPFETWNVLPAFGAVSMNRRDFSRTVGVLLLTARTKGQDVRNTPARRGTTQRSKKVAGIPLVDSAICRKATDLAQECYPTFLFNHAMRTYLFGALVGRAANMNFDEELLYLGCILHDIGLTNRFMGERPFEIEGAESARKFLERQGLPKAKSAIVWDGIALHAQAASEFKRPEISLVAAGAGVDVVGAGLADLSSNAKAEVLAAFPRLKFKTSFVNICADVARRHPRGATRGFMRDIADRYVPDFKARNICDLIEHAPFEE